MNKEINSSIKMPWIKTIISIGLLVIATTISLYVSKFGIGLWDKPDQWGQLGDFFGGILNPILGFLSLIFLLITLHQNQKAIFQNKLALEQNKEALIINTKELELTRDQVSGSREALELQAKILEKQNFEGTFFQLLSLYNEIVNSIDIKDTTGRDCFVGLKRHLDRYLNREISIDDLNSNNLTNNNLNKGYLSFYKNYQSELGHYFRIIYNIIKFVENSSVKEKKYYCNLLRAQLSTYELILIFYNCLSTEGIKFKPLIEKYSLLKFLPDDETYFTFQGREFDFYRNSAYE